MTNYYKNDDLSFTPFTHEQETELFQRAETGDLEARDKIVRNYLQFAASEGLHESRGQFPEDEVLSAANEGLMVAVGRFNWRANNRFSCFARRFIRGRVGHLRRSRIRQSQREVSGGLGAESAKAVTNCDFKKNGYGFYRTNENHVTDHGSDGEDWKAFWLTHAEKFIKTLSDSQQRVIHCVIFEDKPFVLVAKEMKVTPNAVRRLYYSGIEALTKLVKATKS